LPAGVVVSIACWSNSEELAPTAGAEVRFELQDTQGRTVRAADLRGRWVLAFFGYTSCPDICPTALTRFPANVSADGIVIRLHVARWHQPHGVAERLELPRPTWRCRAHTTQSS